MNPSEIRLRNVIDAAVLHHALSRYAYDTATAALIYFVQHARYIRELRTQTLLAIADLARNYRRDWQRRAAAAHFREYPRAMQAVWPLPKIPIRGKPFPWVNRIYHGEFPQAASFIPDHTVDLVITSPPYAMQRRKLYGGIKEAAYPQWTIEWMAEVRRILKPRGSVAVIIRPHVRDGEISEYVAETIRMLRHQRDEAGKRCWYECDQLIWIKPDGPPVGHRGRARRVYEPVHWFAPDRQPFCDPVAGGHYSERVGITTADSIAPPCIIVATK
jgi:hypothetical protein